MYIRSLKISNLRCFRDAEISLQFPGQAGSDPPEYPNVNLLLGINGSGKTTLLKAIALAVLSRILPSSGFVPYNLIRRSPRERPEYSEIKADLALHAQDLISEGWQDKAEIRMRIQRMRTDEDIWTGAFTGDPQTWAELYEESSPALFLVGYGATRWVIGSSQAEPIAAQRKRRRLRYQRVAGLFEEHVGLTPLSAWLPQLENERPDQFEEISSLIDRMLPAGTHFLRKWEADEYLFSHCGVTVPLGALSDGYRAYIGWISDLLQHLASITPPNQKIEECRGVVLIDEIDLHLHPAWQREVVPMIAQNLPRLQFVLTTHSPIVAGTLHWQNIFVVEMEEDGSSSVRQLRERIHGLNADQVLVSSYFNLDTTRAPSFEDDLRDLSKKAMAGDEDAAVAYLKKLATGSEDEAAEVPAEADV